MHIQPTFRARHADIAERDPSTIGLLTAGHAAAVTFYPENAVIFAQGDLAGPLYFVEFGTVRICRLTADGRRQILAFHTAGDVFGFECGAEHESYAESVDGAGIRVLRRSGQAHDGSLLTLAVKSLARAQAQLTLLGRRTANERLAALLCDLAERQGSSEHVHLAMQRNDIADYLGLTFETVSRILRTFKDHKLIRLTAVSEIDILDHAALAAMCD